MLYFSVFHYLRLCTLYLNQHIVNMELGETFPYTVECHYNAVRFIIILHAALWWQQQNLYQTLTSQQTPHASHSRVSYGVPIVRILKKTDHVITALCCIWWLWSYSKISQKCQVPDWCLQFSYCSELIWAFNNQSSGFRTWKDLMVKN